jgi:hypothetical protein
MRVFKKPNLSGDWKCPICKTNEEKEVILAGIYGTKEGKTMEAKQFHLDCIDLIYYSKDVNWHQNMLNMSW